ncbi:hypothetical protein LLH23_12840 [bacterium]|nr:hypothetical protein [bacterium]
MERVLAAIALVALAIAARAQEPPMPDRLVLEKVPYVGPNWGGKLDGPQDFMFPSVVAALMKFLDPRHPYGYRFYLDVSGMAYRQFWHPAKWDCAFDNVWAVCDDPVEPIRRCFAAAGYDFRLIGNRELCRERPLVRDRLPEYADPEPLRQVVMRTLRAGKPVIAIGLYSGAAIVAGYEQQGDVLVGWTMDEKLPTGADGYQRFADWLQHAEAVIIPGGKREPLPLREVCRQTLAWAIEGSRRPLQGEYRAGQESFNALAEAFGREGELQAADAAALNQKHFQFFFYTIVVAEGRAFGYDVLDRAAQLEPTVAGDLDAAMDCYHLMHDLVWRLWQTESAGSDPGDGKHLREPETCRELARIVLLQRDLDALAVQHLSRAAAAFGVTADQLPPPTPLEQTVMQAFAHRQQTSGANRARLQRRVVDLWLGAVPELRFMGGRDCTFAAALEAALAPTARPVSYADLMGYSGLAFRTRWFDNPAHEQTAWGASRWHPVSPHGEGPEELAALSRATGWQFRRDELPADVNSLARRRVITDVVVSINDGLPVVAMRNTDLATVYGYNIHSMNLFLRDMQHPQVAELRVPENDAGLCGPIIFLAGLGPEPPPAQVLMDSLKLAVSNARRAPQDHFRYGLEALAAWERALAEADQCSDEERQLLFLVNWWSLMHLADARRAAADFLAAHADLVAPTAKADYAAAHRLFQQEAGLLDRFAQQHTRYLMWWGGAAQAKDWTPADRQAQRELLAQCRGLEQWAFAALAEVGAD